MYSVPIYTRIKVPSAQKQRCLHARIGLDVSGLSDRHGDGQRFMLIVPDDATPNPLTLVNSWPTLVKARR